MTPTLVSSAPDLDGLTTLDTQHLQEEFFSAIKDGPNKLTAFHNTWSNFSAVLKNSVDNLSADTLEMIYSLASTIGVVAANMLECQEESDTLYEELSTDIWNVLEIGVQNLSIDDNPRPAHIPAYIEPSHAWLLANIHNPYPSQLVREAIAKQCGCQRKLIDNWFTDARKRIGWNSLRKDLFSNRRADIVDAATRFWVEEDPCRPLAFGTENRLEAVRTAAHRLYSGRFDASKLAVKLDSAVKDMTPEMRHTLQSQKNTSDRQCKKPVPVSFSYPTPNTSPGTSPESLSPSSSISSFCEYDRSLKRRRSCNGDTSHSPKRKRTHTPSSDIGLPSPSASTGDLEDDGLAVADLPAVQVDSEPSMTCRKRKRSLSGDRVSKRPHIQPCEQTLSTTLSMSPEPFDSWMKEYIDSSTDFFAFPPPVTFGDFDSTVPLEIELSNFPLCNAPQSTQFVKTAPAEGYPEPNYSMPASQTSYTTPDVNPAILESLFNFEMPQTNLQRSPLDLDHPSNLNYLWDNFSVPIPGLEGLPVHEQELLRPANQCALDPLESLKEAKTRELLFFEAKLDAIRAELNSIP